MQKLKIISLLVIVSLFFASLASCMVKKDCKGHTKHKQENGIWF